jgi:putative addiction module component (TIGR02574 family)
MLLPMAASQRVQQALAAASVLSKEEREELILELWLGLEHERSPEGGYDQAWSEEIARRIDSAAAGTSRATPWTQVRGEIEAALAARRGSAR